MKMLMKDLYRENINKKNFFSGLLVSNNKQNNNYFIKNILIYF